MLLYYYYYYYYYYYFPVLILNQFQIYLDFNPQSVIKQEMKIMLRMEGTVNGPTASLWLQGKEMTSLSSK